jgi:hypothetical protein
MDKEGPGAAKANDEVGTLRTNCAEGCAPDVVSVADGTSRLRARLGAGPDRAIAAGAGIWRTWSTSSVGVRPARVLDVTGAASANPIEGAGLPRVRFPGPPTCKSVVLEVDIADADAANPIVPGAGMFRSVASAGAAGARVSAAGEGKARLTAKEGAGAPMFTGAAAGIPKTETRTAAAVANAAAETDACRLTEREGAGSAVFIAAADGTCNTVACDKAGAGSARVTVADGTAKLIASAGAAAAVAIFVGVGQSRAVFCPSVGEGLDVTTAPGAMQSRDVPLVGCGLDAVIATGSGACSVS